MLRLSIHGNGLPLLSEAAEILGSQAKAQRAYRRALNEAGRDVTAPTYRALAKQTGLKTMVARKALRPQKASMTSLTFELRGTGGDIGLKHFGARETRGGVSAAPFGQRGVFGSSFIKGGRWGNRKTLPFKDTVFEPAWRGTGKAQARWGRPFEKMRSGVVIPTEMVKGETARTFQTKGGSLLAEKVARHISLSTHGVLT